MEANNKILSIGFYSKIFQQLISIKRSTTKIILAIIDLFQEWRQYLEGIFSLVTMYTHHKNLKYFILACVSNYWKACWLISLWRLKSNITYQTRKQSFLLDDLSRHTYFVAKEGEVIYHEKLKILLKL